MGLFGYKKWLIVALTAVAVSSCAKPKALDPQIVENRVAHMYTMRTIGVELVEMYETENIDDARVAALSKQLVGQSIALQDFFPIGSSKTQISTSNALPVVWSEKAKFQVALASFQTKAAALDNFVATNGAADAWPKIKETGDACTSCHTQFRSGGDPSHD